MTNYEKIEVASDIIGTELISLSLENAQIVKQYEENYGIKYSEEDAEDIKILVQGLSVELVRYLRGKVNG